MCVKRWWTNLPTTASAARTTSTRNARRSRGRSANDRGKVRSRSIMHRLDSLPDLRRIAAHCLMRVSLIRRQDVPLQRHRRLLPLANRSVWIPSRLPLVRCLLCCILRPSGSVPRFAAIRSNTRTQSASAASEMPARISPRTLSVTNWIRCTTGSAAAVKWIVFARRSSDASRRSTMPSASSRSSVRTSVGPCTPTRAASAFWDEPFAPLDRWSRMSQRAWVRPKGASRASTCSRQALVKCASHVPNSSRCVDFVACFMYVGHHSIAI